MLKQLGRTALAAKKLITINKYFKNTLPQKKKLCRFAELMQIQFFSRTARCALKANRK